MPDTENLIQFAKLFDLSLDNILLGEEKIMVKNYGKKSYKNTNTIISFCNFFKFSFHLNSVRILLF
ncbi:hypothetical protein NNO52_14705 [Enterococcus faecium]|nr:hypothetical protein [Enterococcus faecium]